MRLAPLQRVDTLAQPLPEQIGPWWRAPLFFP